MLSPAAVTFTSALQGLAPSAPLSQLGATPAATPSLTVSPTSGPVGTVALAEGLGFATDSKVTVTWDSSAAVCSGLAASTGVFECYFDTPASPAGAQTLTAENGSDIASTTFTVVPKLTESPTSGPAGTSVTFTWTGFDANAALEVTWQSGTTFACTARTNGVGASAPCTYAIPPGTTTGGPYVFTATDVNGSSASTNFTVTYTPRLSVSPSSGAAGTVVTISGSGFASASSVTVTWRNLSTVVCTVTADSTGGFSCSFTIPSGPEGIETLTGVDSNSGTGVAIFAVVSEPSPSPASSTGGGLWGLSSTAAGALVGGLAAWGAAGTLAAILYARRRRPPAATSSDLPAPTDPLTRA